MPHITVIAAMNREGRNFFRTRFEGISKVTYVTNKIETAVLVIQLISLLLNALDRRLNEGTIDDSVLCDKVYLGQQSPPL